MPKRQKPKVKGNAGDKRYDGKASSVKRNEIQLNAHIANGSEDLTPWEKAKAARLADRIAKGKTRENWERTNVVREPKANVSNLSTSSVPRDKLRNPFSDRNSSKVYVAPEYASELNG